MFETNSPNLMPAKVTGYTVANSIAENSEFRVLEGDEDEDEDVNSLASPSVSGSSYDKDASEIQKVFKQKNDVSVHRTNELVPSPTHYN